MGTNSLSTQSLSPVETCIFNEDFTKRERETAENKRDSPNLWNVGHNELNHLFYANYIFL